MAVGTYNFPIQQEGDTFNSVQFTCTTTSNAVTTPIDLTSVSIKMQLRKTYQSEALLTLESGSGITITDAVNGVFRIDEFINISAYNYLYDIQFTYNSGVVKTYVKGFLEVLKEVTR
jgi:hypothetical protein